MSGVISRTAARAGLALAVALLLAACASANGTGSTGSEPAASTPSEPAVAATAESNTEPRDYSDFAVAQSVVQESIDELSSAAIGSGSAGLTELRTALDETGPTENWCTAVQAGVDALEFARSRAQAEALASAATAQGC